MLLSIDFSLLQDHNAQLKRRESRNTAEAINALFADENTPASLAGAELSDCSKIAAALTTVEESNSNYLHESKVFYVINERNPGTGFGRPRIYSRNQAFNRGQDLVDDIEIIKSVQAGNSEAFSLLVDRYHHHLLNFIYRLLGNSQLVEDIGQEIFLSIYKSIRSFNVQRGVPFAAWLFITARNRCCSELRRKRPQTVSIKTNEIHPAENTPEQAACEEERIAAIHAALDQLPEPYKRTILQSLNGDSPEEIARALQISRGTVKSRLSRARQKMKSLLNGSLGANFYGRL
jgi:RNA polymerase sigma-70 factor, ECF subfamily